MKKKGILIFVVLLLSMTAIFFAKEMQKKLVSNEVASKTESKVLQGNLQDNTNENIQSTDKASNSEIKNDGTKEASKTDQQNSSNKVSETSKQSTSKTSTPKSSNTNTAASTTGATNTNANSNLPANFIVMDDRNKNILLSKHIELNNETVADITKQILTKQNIEWKAKSGDYFYEIAELKERSDGPLSGWCYFVNGTKAKVGAGSYVPKKDDKIEWKFLKDGVNN